MSLTDKPTEEVKAAQCILESLGLRNGGIQLISCPTCGRCEPDLIRIVKDLENKLAAKEYQQSAYPFKVAVMGCVVNGPGEAKEADIGVAFGRQAGLLFKKGKPIKKVAAANCARVLLKEIKQCIRR